MAWMGGHTSLENQQHIVGSTIKVIPNPKPDRSAESIAECSDSSEETIDNESQGVGHIEIDPFQSGRPWFYNYTLLISGTAPKPLTFVTTLKRDGKGARVTPFNYFRLVQSNPPTLIFGFSGMDDRYDDFFELLKDNQECVINIASRHMIDAANAISGKISKSACEWTLSRLHPLPSTTVKAPRLRESVFAIEGKLLDIVDLNSSNASKNIQGRLAIVQGSRFWVREDATDEKQTRIDIDILNPISQIGGLSISRISDTPDLIKSSWKMAMDSGSLRLNVAIDQTISNRQ